MKFLSIKKAWWKLFGSDYVLKFFVQTFKKIKHTFFFFGKFTVKKSNTVEDLMTLKF